MFMCIRELKVICTLLPEVYYYYMYYYIIVLLYYYRSAGLRWQGPVCLSLLSKGPERVDIPVC